MLNVYYIFIYDRRVWCKCLILNTGKYNSGYKKRRPVHYKCSLLYNCISSITHLMYFHACFLYYTCSSQLWIQGLSQCATGFCSSCIALQCVCFTTSVCASASTAWYCIIFSLPTFTKSLWDSCTQNTRYVRVPFLSHKFSLIIGIWLYKYHSHVEWNITTSSPLNMGIYCTCC